jgi:uncharacterized protein YqeY
MMLKARITEDMKNAMRAKETTRLSTIRMLLAAMKQREVDERIERKHSGEPINRVVAMTNKLGDFAVHHIVKFEKAFLWEVCSRR